MGDRQRYMSMQKMGFFKVPNDFMNDPMWVNGRPFDEGKAWIDLLGAASYSDRVMHIRGNIINLKLGDFAISEDHLASRWNWSRNKVRSYMKRLISLKKVQQNLPEKVQQNKNPNPRLIKVYSIVSDATNSKKGTTEFVRKSTTEGTTEGTTHIDIRREEKKINKKDFMLFEDVEQEVRKIVQMRHDGICTSFKQEQLEKTYNFLSKDQRRAGVMIKIPFEYH